jgi:phosphate transport system substrate-binding protein
MATQRLRYAAASLILATLLGACGTQTTQQPTDTQTTPTAGAAKVTGDIKADGSSTVFPIAEAMAEEFQNANPGTRVTVGVSGTGGGFKKFCAGETDISNASRPIKKSEMELCQKNGIEYVELPVAYDGLSVVVNPANDWAKCMTPDELKTMWSATGEGKVKTWNQVSAQMPSNPLVLYGPGTDSGTFDYFKEAIIGKDDNVRGDFTATEDDNLIVQGVSKDPNALGFFGIAYLEQNADKLRGVEIKNGQGQCVAPTVENVRNGTYNPLSRPLFIYVNSKSLEKPQVKAFTQFFIAPDEEKFITEAGFVPLPAEILPKVQARFDNRTLGTVFAGGSDVGVDLAKVL